MQRLRQPADVVERALRDLADFAQVASQRRPLGRVLAGAAEHRAHGGQDLPELVVQLARDLTERRLAGRDELLRELAPLVRKRREPREQRRFERIRYRLVAAIATSVAARNQ